MQQAEEFSGAITDSDLSRKVRKTCDKVTENLYVACNEPMLACFRIQEHVQKTVPILVEKTVEMRKNEPTLKGLLYDIEYSHSSVKSLANCPDQFSCIQQMLKECVFYKQQIDYNESVRRRVQEQRLKEQQSLESTSPSSPKKDSLPPAAPSSSSSSTARSIPMSTKSRSSNAFNRFSTSFDFSSASFPINVASSVSADLKDLKTLITQFASNNLHGHHHPQQQQKTTTSRVSASTSMQVLSESPLPSAEVELTNETPLPIPETELEAKK